MIAPQRGAALARAVRDDAAAAEFTRLVRAARESRLAASKVAVEIDRKAHFVYEGCASFAEFGERHGLSAGEAWGLLTLGLALERWPELEENVLAGAVSETSASRMGSLARTLGAVRPDDDWVAWARGESERSFRRRVRERLESTRRAGRPTVERTFFVSEEGASLFERARVLASRKARRALTEGQALERLADHYLDCFDPMRVTPRRRRMPHTSTLLDRRTVPAEVGRAVMARNGDSCAVPRCPNKIFLERSHRRAHCCGGAREREDLDWICNGHHDMWHLGLLRIEGTTEAPVFKTVDGRPLTGRPTIEDGEPPPAATA